MKRFTILIFVYVLTVAVLASAKDSKIVSGTQEGGRFCDLSVVVKGFENDNGNVKIHLYCSESQGFPTKPSNACRRKLTYVKNGEVRVTFKHLPYGEYAFTVHHDENANGKMDTNFLGIPDEGYGVSNDAKGVVGVGPPSWIDGKFTLNKNRVTKIATMNY